MSLKTLAKNPKRWGLYRPNRKLAVRAELAALTGNGRPVRSTANGQKYDRWATAVDRPGRPRKTATVPVDRFCVCPDVHVCARRSTLRVDRPLVRSTVRVDRPACQHKTKSENLGKIFYKNLLSFSVNPIKLVLTFYIETQTSDKNFKTYINHINSFIKTNTCIFIKLEFFNI